MIDKLRVILLRISILIAVADPGLVRAVGYSRSEAPCEDCITLEYSGECGRSRLRTHHEADAKIGEEKLAKLDQFPWIVTVDSNELCTGTLVHEEYILTSPKCVRYFSDYAVGSSEINTVEFGTNIRENRVDFDKAYLAEMHNSSDGLIAVRWQRTMPDTQPICLIRDMRSLDDFSSSKCVVAGWGDSSSLKYVKVRVPRGDQRKEIDVPDFKTVAGGKMNFGYIGAPLMCTTSINNWALVGVHVGNGKFLRIFKSSRFAEPNSADIPATTPKQLSSIDNICSSVELLIKNSKCLGGKKRQQDSWMITITTRKVNHKCSGTLVNPWYIATEANCVKHINKKLDFALIQKKDPASNRLMIMRKVSFENVQFHKNLNRNYRLKYDLALLKLQQPIYDVPITCISKLPLAQMDNESKCVVTGERENRKTHDHESKKMKLILTDFRPSSRGYFKLNDKTDLSHLRTWTQPGAPLLCKNEQSRDWELSAIECTDGQFLDINKILAKLAKECNIENPPREPKPDCPPCPGTTTPSPNEDCSCPPRPPPRTTPSYPPRPPPWTRPSTTRKPKPPKPTAPQPKPRPPLTTRKPNPDCPPCPGTTTPSPNEDCSCPPRPPQRTTPSYPPRPPPWTRPSSTRKPKPPKPTAPQPKPRPPSTTRKPKSPCRPCPGTTTPSPNKDCSCPPRPPPRTTPSYPPRPPPWTRPSTTRKPKPPKPTAPQPKPKPPSTTRKPKSPCRPCTTTTRRPNDNCCSPWPPFVG